MKKLSTSLLALFILSVGCTSINKTMKQPNTLVRFEKQDFEFSEQLTADATTTRILNIDFERLLNKEGATIENEISQGGPLDQAAYKLISSLPVYGTLLNDPTASYALYNLMKANEGYDVIFYPQYEVKVKRPILGLGFILKITDVKVNAKLAKIKE
ncbi:hypothetical protein [Marivirga sp.]|uniref:hypothetical protein n=1 Tax=Marivirga sp. TaxID=2018662 RepID=UPI002D7FB9B9|nr:hypothetical protein [Marivirga sp.]HET8860828.1 hypothetical protein [Marivirga sp.]